MRNGTKQSTIFASFLGEFKNLVNRSLSRNFLTKRISAKKEEENFKNVMLAKEGNPKPLLQEYGKFLCATSQNFQRYEEASKGLRSLKNPQPIKPIPLAFEDDGRVFINHCETQRVRLSQAQTNEFKSKLVSKLNQIRNHIINEKGSFLGKELDAPVFGGAFDCGHCKARFRLSVRFDWKHITILLMKLQSLNEPILEN